MAWARITEADLLTKISGAELDAFRSAALATGQADPVEPSITTVTNLVRGHIRAHRANVMGAEGTIPKELLGPALDLLVVEIPKRCAGMGMDPDKRRDQAAAVAMSILSRVASGAFALENPVTEATGISTPRPAVTSRPAKLSPALQEGL